MYIVVVFFLFFFNDTATTEIYTLSLHDALPISRRPRSRCRQTRRRCRGRRARRRRAHPRDRKSTRLNSSHPSISYAVFCLKKKKNNYITTAYLQIFIKHNAPQITLHSQLLLVST